mmetsp:Transcript_38066/g.79761  ORF Transcript_38066/g.79761 Transcript_38066/m.79761 type:complete len:366 (-) Transcript_38066:25-1122(-)
MFRSASKEALACIDFKLADRKASLHSAQPLDKGDWKLFSGNSNPILAESVAEHLGVALAPLKCTRFNDGECSIQIIPSVRNTHAYVLQSTSPCRDGSRTINDHIMELFLLIRCLRRASSSTVTAIIPYYGYARQDEKSRPRVPIAASDIAMLLEAAGVSRIVTVDLHSPQIQGQFQQCPVDNLSMFDDFAEFFWNELSSKMSDEDEIAVVSPDAGGVARAKYFHGLLLDKGVKNMSLAIVIRQKTSSSISVNMVGDVAGKHCIIVDDIIDTGVRICTTAEALLDLGAKTVGAVATHGIFTGKALVKIEASDLDYVIVSDTISLPEDVKSVTSKIMQVSCAALISEAIDSINHSDQVTHLFAIGNE